jgi:hypothetical protein
VTNSPCHRKLCHANSCPGSDRHRGGLEGRSAQLAGMLGAEGGFDVRLRMHEVDLLGLDQLCIVSR